MSGLRQPIGRRGAVGRRVALLVFLGLVALAAYYVRAANVAAADPCTPPVQNPIACENSKPGSPPSEWDVSGSGSANIQGFATDISVDRGQTERFKVDTNATDYRLDIYRMGYYGGDGARRVATVQPSAALPQNQPNCLRQAASGLIDCGNWSESASWAVPAGAVSGIYFADLVREDGTQGKSQIYFVVRDDGGGSDILFQTSDTTWQAYNQYGGNSLYTGGPGTNPARAYKVSYNRPFTTRASGPEDAPFNAEYPMVRWLERNGYDVSYFTGVDAARRGAEILDHRTYLSVGHDEYWSGEQRANVEAARAAGVNLAFFSGNEGFWKTRFEPSIDGSNTAYRTLVSYKETHAGAKIDPTQTWTGTWRDPRPINPEGPRPENALSGTIFTVNCCTYAIQVPAADGKLRLWRNTSIANLAPGQTATLPDGTLGYEWDEDLDNGSRPAGLFDLSHTTVEVPQRLQDYGSNYGPGTATHSLTEYRAASGALVFGAGTVQWSWGLDANHDRGASTPDADMQQATVNLLADMHTQPGTLQSGLVAATASSDTTAPSSRISSPLGGANVAAGQPTTITGTAADGGGETGGQVAGVEVSLDGGQSWHPAQGRGSWSYSWTPGAPGSATIKARAVDDSGNLESPGAGVTVNVQPRSCPCSIWDDSFTPPEENDSQAVELGVKFRSDLGGFITGLRFYKTAGNTGTHVGHLWTADGTELAAATFTGETASGWQQVDLGAPVAIDANTTYIASYHAPNGHYAASNGYFAGGGFDSAPLHALGDGVDGANGVFKYGPSGGLFSGGGPDTFQSSNYWVDVVFNTAGPAPETTITSGPTGVTRDSTPTFKFSSSEAGSTFECRFDADPFGPCARAASDTPSSPLADGQHSFEVRATDPAHNTDPTPAHQDFAVDTIAPMRPTITATDPPSPANDNAPNVQGSAEAGSTVKLYAGTGCKGSPVAQGSASRFGSTGIAASVADDTTTVFHVKATDAAGNSSPCSAALKYVEDSTSPDTTITSGPTGTTTSRRPTFAFTSSETRSTFECRFDSDPFGPCSGSGKDRPATALPLGDHTFYVRATDAADNTDATPAQQTFTIAR